MPPDLEALTGPHELRLPWARLDGVFQLLGWASDTLGAVGRPVTGPGVQRRTWNLAALFQLPTANGPAWLKATPRFAADEASVIAAFARVDPTLVPPVEAWAPYVPGCDPARALRVAEPLAHLAYAVRYRCREGP